MFKKEEEQLKGFKKEYDNMPVSLDSLDQAIMAGFNKAKFEDRQSVRKKRKIYSFIAAALLLIGLFSSIRISPALASYISEIPGMEKIVNMIRDDKGRMVAVEQKYYQELGVSDEIDGLKVTIDGTISDEMGIILFYTLESDEKMKEIEIEKVNINAKDGTYLDEATISYGEVHYSEEGERTFSGEIEYFFEAPLTTKEYVVDLEVKGKKFSMPLTLKDFKEKKEYPVNQTMELEGQKINIEKISVYPLRVAVHLKMDPNNTKQILHLDDLRLVDENNEVWGKIANGFTGSGDKDSDQEIYLQSNYFQEPKELYLVLNSAQAVDKDNATIVVDTDKLEILKQPSGDRLSNVRFEENELVFDLTAPKNSNFYISNVTDAQGKIVETHSQSWGSSDDTDIKRVGIELPTIKSQQNPLSMEVAFFPSWIKGNDKIRIK
jgi:Family of unknown function (DUF5643)/Domain of unknown function (DUF4179)